MQAVSSVQLGLRRPCLVRPRLARTQASWVPDYQQPDTPGSKIRKHNALCPKQPPAPGQQKKWWEYAAPGADVGRPGGYQLKAVGIPQFGADGGDGGSSGKGGSGGGGGGGGGGGDPMKGFTYLYALLLFAGGMAAYVRKGSSKSLLVSSAVAVLLLICASLMSHPTSRSGTILAMATCLGLAGVMGYRAKSSEKVVSPPALVALLSALMSAGYAKSLA